MNDMIGLVKSSIIKVFTSLIRIVDLIWPKNKNLILCGAPRYYGNPRYFFEHIIKNKSPLASEFTSIWMTRDHDLCNQLNSLYRKEVCLHLLSIKGILTFLRARYLFFSHGASDFFYFVGKNNPRKTVVNLWHGTPIKKMDGLVPGTKMRWDYMTAGSQFEKLSFENISDVDFADIIISGHPRNEYLVSKISDNEYVEERKTNIINSFNFQDTKIILYAPTYRHHAPTELFPFPDFDVNKLSKFLQEHELIMIIRFHPNDRGPVINKKYQNIMDLERIKDGSIEKYPSMQDFLLISDILITDYSSSYFDFLLTYRPTIFIPYDQNKYEKLYGFSLNYDELVKGLKVETQAELFNKLKDILNEKPYIQSKINNDFSKYHQYELESVCDTILRIICK